MTAPRASQDATTRQHGLPATYSYGKCRCQACRDAAAAWRRAYRARKAPAPPAPPAEAPEGWDDEAACKGMHSDIFFPVAAGGRRADDAIYGTALAVCRRCPVQTHCLTAARARREESGVWGGVVFDRRVRLRERKKKAAS